MTDIFRELCAELLDALEGYIEYAPVIDVVVEDEQQLVANARVALVQPESQGPSDEELEALWRLGWQSKDSKDGAVLFAKEVLARWGRPAIEPVPVSERLPGPGDCDGEGCCWWWIVDQPGELPHWIYCTLEKLSWTNFRHWLPHHALPVPQQEVE
jgi:hypothetical protein